MVGFIQSYCGIRHEVCSYGSDMNVYRPMQWPSVTRRWPCWYCILSQQTWHQFTEPGGMEDFVGTRRVINAEAWHISIPTLYKYKENVNQFLCGIRHVFYELDALEAICGRFYSISPFPSQTSLLLIHLLPEEWKAFSAWAEQGPRISFLHPRWIQRFRLISMRPYLWHALVYGSTATWVNVIG